MKAAFILLTLCISILNSQSQINFNKSNSETMADGKVVKTEESWKNSLTPEQYRVLREGDTEPAYSGVYTHYSEKGTYVCGGCGYELFSSEMKFESHCGWPSFDSELGGGNRVIKKSDYSFGMNRIEILCARCGGHLGHIFPDGPTATGNRYCVNSLSLKFIPQIATFK